MFVEQNGRLIIEAESINSLTGDWKTRSQSNSSGAIDNPGGATGGDFIVWEGDDHFNDPTNGVLTYEIEITTPGLYQFEWRSQVGQGTQTADHNDSWLKIDADMFYGREVQEDGSVSYVYPPGPPPDPSTHPQGAEAAHGGYNNEGFFKVFSSKVDWTWSTKTSDGSYYDIFAQFDEPGTYEIQIAARSSHHVIDRLVMHHVDYEGDPYDLSLPESDRAGTTTPPAEGEVSIFLLDAAVNSRVAEIEDGDSFSANLLYRDTFSLAVETTRTDVSSARLTWIDDQGAVLHQHVDNTEFYTLFGDSNGQVITEGLPYELGAQSLRVELFTGADARGTKVVDQTTAFTMTDEPLPPRPGDGTVPQLDPNGLAAWADEIVFQYDGNQGDPDDIAAMPIAALMAKAAGIADKTSFFYGNAALNSANPRNDLLPLLEQSAEFSRGLGIDAYSYQEDIDGTVARLVAMIETGDNILLIEGGRLDATYRALLSVDPALHSNVTMLSHSIWNENGSYPTWSDMEVELPDVNYVRITDQNNGPRNTKGFRNEDWAWMDASDDASVQEARDLMALAGPDKVNDPSDAGMLYYALTGDERGTALDVKAMVENPVDVEPPSGPQNTPPVAVDDRAQTAQNKTIVVDVLANDRDADGNRLRLTDVEYEGSTSFVSIADGKIVVNPKSSATHDRTETITYTVSDGQGGTDEGTLEVQVGEGVVAPLPPQNQAPVAVDEAASTVHNKTIVVDVLANDRDADDDTLTVTDVFYGGSTSFVSIENGKVVVNPMSSATEARVEKIEYTVSDGQGAFDKGMLEVQVSGEKPVEEKMFAVYFADTVSNETIAELEQSDRVSKSEIGENVTLSLWLNDANEDVDYVELSLGDHSRTERVEPYALFGDSDGDFFGGTSLGVGSHELEYKAYRNDEVVEQETITFLVE